MNAIILASGKGTRMLPWTATKNKCMFKVGGKPLLLYHIENLKRVGVQNIFVTVHHNYLDVIKQIPADINIYKEDELSGSGTAVKEVFEKYDLKRAVIVYGDTWYDPVYYNSAVRRYKDSFDRNIILVYPASDINETGVVLFDRYTNSAFEIFEDGFLRDTKNYSIPANINVGKNIGLLILNKTVLGYGDLMHDVLPKHIDKLYANCLYKPEKWVDIGDFTRYTQLVYSGYQSQFVKWLVANELVTFIKFTKKILLADRIFICGNGGSLSTAEHLSLDFSKVGCKNAIALNSAPVITAYSNDESYENIFTRQLRCFNISEKDVIILLSGSGNSPNIVNVAQQYPKNIIAMSGQKGFLIDNVKLTLPVNSDNIRIIEDAHLSYGHAITEVMEGLA